MSGSEIRLGESDSAAINLYFLRSVHDLVTNTIEESAGAIGQVIASRRQGTDCSNCSIIYPNLPENKINSEP
jgi:hypothetical protein